jgi:GNAT superfamily N-acetyltransferase
MCELQGTYVPQQTYSIHTMTARDLELAAEWAAAEGWNPGLHDAQAYFQADPAGFLIGRLDGKPIASISVVKYGAEFGFLGFYIVIPEYRGQGFGLRIWQAGLDYLTGCTIGLDGVAAQQDNYKKSGFKLAYRNIRCEGHGTGPSQDPEGIVDLSELPFSKIATYDRPFFPLPRPTFLKGWIDQPDSHALGLVDDEQLRGYGVLRPCRTGYKIGPLFADRPDIARDLLQALRSRVSPDDLIYLDIPEPNSAAVELIEHHGMQVVFETARMYTGPAPDISVDRTYGVTSFEIG